MNKLMVSLALIVALAAGCSSEQQASVQVKDFSIGSPSDFKSGKVTFRVHNSGPGEHEMVILKTSLGPDSLPTDGDKVNEEAKGIESPGEIEDIVAGKTKSATFDLKPGSYVLICNLPGHYAKGMRAGFKVTG